MTPPACGVGVFAGPPEWHRAKLLLNQQAWCNLLTSTNSNRNGIGFAKPLLIDSTSEVPPMKRNEKRVLGNGEGLSNCVRFANIDSFSTLGRLPENRLRAILLPFFSPDGRVSCVRGPFTERSVTR